MSETHWFVTVVGGTGGVMLTALGLSFWFEIYLPHRRKVRFDFDTIVEEYTSTGKLSPWARMRLEQFCFEHTSGVTRRMTREGLRMLRNDKTEGVLGNV